MNALAFEVLRRGKRAHRQFLELHHWLMDHRYTSPPPAEWEALLEAEGEIIRMVRLASKELCGDELKLATATDDEIEAWRRAQTGGGP